MVTGWQHFLTIRLQRPGCAQMLQPSQLRQLAVQRLELGAALVLRREARELLERRQPIEWDCVAAEPARHHSPKVVPLHPVYCWPRMQDSCTPLPHAGPGHPSHAVALTPSAQIPAIAIFDAMLPFPSRHYWVPRAVQRHLQHHHARRPVAVAKSTNNAIMMSCQQARCARQLQAAQVGELW